MAAAAALIVGLASVAALAVGFLLLSKLGGTSGRNLGGGAAASAFANAVPLLILAETLKLVTAAAQLVVVHRTAPAPAGAAGWMLAAAGYLGASLIAASGIFGFWAVATHSQQMGVLISALGFYGIAATGVWALMLVLRGADELRRWHAAAGIAFAAACLAALAVPPAAMLSAAIGWAWWFGLAARLRRH
jgi:hypothetical protein